MKLETSPSGSAGRSSSKFILETSQGPAYKLVLYGDAVLHPSDAIVASGEGGTLEDYLRPAGEAVGVLLSGVGNNLHVVL